MSKSENRALPEQIHLRLPVGLAGVVRREAEKLELTDASYVRHVLAKTHHEADSADVLPSKRKRPQNKNPSLDLVEISALRSSVGHLVGTLRQVAKLTRKDGESVIHSEIESILTRIYDVAGALDECKKRLF
jgi:hypothetical protein